MAAKELNGEDKFLVRVGDGGQYLKSFDGTNVEVTSVPSFALHCSYVQADQWCRRLQKRGFPRSVVANLFGQMMTAGMVKVELQLISEQARQSNLPQTWADLNRISAAECQERSRKEPGFKEAVERIAATPRPAPKARAV